MKVRRRVAAVVVTAVVAGALIGGPARAQTDTPEVFAGTASGLALELTVFGQGLTLGATEASGANTPEAAAAGAGQLLPIGVGESEAEASAEGQSATDGENCSPLVLPESIPGLSASLACSTSSAAIASGVPTSTSDAHVGEIVLEANELLGLLGLDEPVSDGVDTVLDTLEPLFNQFDDTPLEEPIDTVGDLLDSVVNTTTLRVAAGTSAASVTGDAASITASGAAQGVVIEVLPEGAIDPDVDPLDPTIERRPVLTIEVGASSATASYNRATGEATADADPALVRVTVDRTVALALGLNDGSEHFVIALAPGQSICLLPQPLESCIIAADASTEVNADGSASAVADAVRLELLKGLQGGVVLGLAHVNASIAGTPPVAAPAPAAELPRTGGTAILPILGIAMLGLAVATRRLFYTIR